MTGKKIGFIGLGIMGYHMASHLLKAGYELAVFDIDSTAMERIDRAPGTVTKVCCAREAAEFGEVVITMVPDSPHVEAAVFGENGILAAAAEGTCHIDMSTIAPATAVRVSEAEKRVGMTALDAPVSGGESGAEQATLSIMVGGEKDIFDRMAPILKVMGKTITYCGKAGAGQTVKACNQIQVAMNFIGMAEAFTLGKKAGVDPEIILQVLSGGYAQTRVMDVRGPKLIRGDFEPGFKSRFHYKDLGIIMDTAKQYQVALPATAVAQQLYTSLLANGYGDLDHSAVIKAIELLSCSNDDTAEESE